MMTFFKFELKSWMRAPMPWIFMFLFGLLCFFGTISDDITIGGGYGNIHKNAPFVAQNWFGIFSIMCILLVAAFVNSTAIRDFQYQTHQVVFTKPIQKLDYYFGHFFGAFIVTLIPFLGITLGMVLGTIGNNMFEWMDKERFGALDFSGHLYGFLVFAIPNTFFISAILYAIATTTRSTLYPFIGAILLMVGYIASASMLRNMENEQLAAMLDPLGISPFRIATKYWTVGEKNMNALGLSGVLLLNRSLWMAIGAIGLIIGYYLFDFSEKKAKNIKKSEKLDATPLSVQVQDLGEFPRVAPSTGLGTGLRQFWSVYSTEMKGMIKSMAFLLLALLGLLNTVPNMFSANEGYGTHELPVTYTMIDLIRGAFNLFVVIIVVYYSGYLIWKERNAKMDEIHDAFPVKNWPLLVGKYFAVVTLVFLLEAIAMLAAIAVQSYLGYNQHNIGMYVRELLVMDMLAFSITIALSMLVHTLVRNMYIGMAVVIGILLIFNIAFPAWNINHNLVNLGGRPSYTLSDFYGYKPFFKGLAWFNGYWALFSALMLLGATIFWQRGRETGSRNRLQLATQEWKHYKTPFLLTAFAFLAVGGWIFYNTNLLNSYKNGKQQELDQAEYEKRYKKHEKSPQPKIYNAFFDITLRPEERSMVVNGTYSIRNLTTYAIDSLFITKTETATEMDITHPRLQLIHDDKDLQFRVYKISPALAPNDTLDMKFVTTFKPKGIENELSFSKLVQNGTFLNNMDIAPNIGYLSQAEIDDKNDRKKHGLPEKSRMPVFNRKDTAALSNTYISNDANWIHLETIIRTSPDQIAIAPGSLVKEWTEGDRRCFQYKLEQKAWNFYSFLSGTYTKTSRKWKDIDLEVYYLPQHDHNVQRLLTMMEKSLDYYTTNFGPYYHKQCRIIEFPRFSSFAQAFPGTMPYSESVGFIQDFKGPDEDLDMMGYVSAHEIGHQYWAHQACGGHMQGAEMTTETFSQYSAIMVMEKEYGRDHVQRFLKYEMDNYLKGRGREREKEQPLMLCESQQYAHYNKGSVAMYYLKEMIGEDSLNAALRAYLEKFRYQEPPFPTSADAIDAFYAHTPDSLRYVVKDLFEEITLFDGRCEKLEHRTLENGKVEITMQVSAQKFKANAMGIETEVPINDYIEIGAIAKPEEGKKLGKTLYRQRVKITQPKQTFVFVTDEMPNKAGIDPFSLLVDRNPIDNVKEVR